MVACAVSGATRAAAEAGGRGGDNGTSTDTLTAMNMAAAAAAAAASDRQRGEGDAMDAGDEDSGSTRSDCDVDDGNSSRKACLPQGHVLMRQAVMADQCPDNDHYSCLNPEDFESRFLWFSGNTIGQTDCNLRDGEELLLVRPKRLAPVLQCPPEKNRFYQISREKRYWDHLNAPYFFLWNIPYFCSAALAPNLPIDP